jgi:hypothetical protein
LGAIRAVALEGEDVSEVKKCSPSQVLAARHGRVWTRETLPMMQNKVGEINDFTKTTYQFDAEFREFLGLLAREKM